MPELYSFPEGAVHVYTGTTASSGSPLAYVQSQQLTVTRQWQTDPSLSGVYRDHLVGVDARVNVNLGYTFDKTLQKIYESATAIHMKFIHNNVNGSAGYFLMSGRIDSLAYDSQQGGVFMCNFAAHANQWSAF